MLAWLQGDQIHQQSAPGGAPRIVGRLVDAQGVHSPLVGEEQQLLVGIDDGYLHYCIVVPVVCPTYSLAAPSLVAVGADGHALDVAALAQRDDHIFLHDELFNGLLLQFLGNYHGATRIGVLALDLAGFPLDLGPYLLRVLQQVLQPGDGRQQVVVFLVEALTFQRSQPAQLHIEDGLGLDLRQVELLHQVVAGSLNVLAVADGLDYRVYGVESLEQTLHDVGPVPRPPQLILGPPPDDVFAVGDEMVDQVLERQFLRLPVHQS